MSVGAGFPDGPGGPGGPGIGTGTSARADNDGTALLGSGTTGVPPRAFTCSRRARTSPANVDTAWPRRLASVIASFRADASLWIRADASLSILM